MFDILSAFRGRRTCLVASCFDGTSRLAILEGLKRDGAFVGLLFCHLRSIDFVPLLGYDYLTSCWPTAAKVLLHRGIFFIEEMLYWLTFYLAALFALAFMSSRAVDVDLIDNGFLTASIESRPDLLTELLDRPPRAVCRESCKSRAIGIPWLLLFVCWKLSADKQSMPAHAAL